MKRKVIKQGNNTLTITLPRTWTGKFNIKPGDELDVAENDRNLVIGGHKDTKEYSISVDVSGLDRTTILILLQGIYRYGHDRIEITSKHQSVPHYRIAREVSMAPVVYNVTNRFVGAEVVSASEKRFLVKRLADESIDDFQNVLRRVFLLLNEMMDSFIKGAKKNDLSVLDSIEFQHTNIKRFINFCLRLLNKYGYEDARKTCFYFHIISLLSKSDDIIKNNARRMLMHKAELTSKHSIELLEDIRHSIRGYYKLFYSYDLKKVTELGEHRDVFKEKLFKKSKHLSKEENLVMGGLSQIVELVLDMTETRMGLEEENQPFLKGIN